MGFLPASGITGAYTTDTVDAVWRFSAQRLIIDGVAGPKRSMLYEPYLKALQAIRKRCFGQIPGGLVIGIPAIERVWKRGEVAVVTDVKTNCPCASGAGQAQPSTANPDSG